jgi:hypothetical protein
MRMVCDPWTDSESYVGPTWPMVPLWPTSRHKALAYEILVFNLWRIIYTIGALYMTVTLRVWHWGIINLLMLEFAQKYLNFLRVNWVLLLVIMLLGMPNQYIISLMNSTTWATVMEVAGFTLIYFVSLSTAMKMCMNPPFAFLNGPIRSSSHVKRPSD